MDENRISGTARNVGGKVEEDLGRVTGDTKTQAVGIAKQITGAAQDMYGQARDVASDMEARLAAPLLRLKSFSEIPSRPSPTHQP